MNWYKMLWSRIGGRPFTYIWRDIYHEAEWVIQSFWFWVGIATTCLIIASVIDAPFWNVFKMVAPKALPIWTLYTFGYICGHIHWGSKWIKGQQGK